MNRSTHPSSTHESPRWFRRAADLGPVLTILLLHGFTLRRMVVVVPAMLIILGFTFTRRFPSKSRTADVVIGLLGVVVGIAFWAFGTTPEGSFPLVVASPVAGGLVGLAVTAAITRQMLTSWAYSGLLLAISLNVQPGIHTWTLLAIVGLSLVIGIATMARPQRVSIRWLGTFSAFLAVTGAGSFLAYHFILAMEGVLLNAMVSFLGVDELASGLGFQSWIVLKPVSEVSLDDRVLMELKGVPPRFLRTVVMDRFDGDEWTVSPRMAEIVAREFVLRENAPLEFFTLTLYQGMRGTIPAPAGTRTLDDAPPHWTRGWLVVGDPVRGSSLEIGRDLQESLPAGKEPGPELLVVPAELADGLRPIADAIVSKATNDMQRTRALFNYLVTNNTYSLRTDLRGDAHPLVVLVRDHKAAYCIYFASAMAAMLRIEGIPSRVVGGFVPVEHNPFTGTTTVRQRDAHAWVEAWIHERDGTGSWVAMDPTPTRDDEKDELGMLHALKQLFGHIALMARTHPTQLIREVIISWPMAVIAGGVMAISIWRRFRSRKRTSKEPMARAVVDSRLAPFHNRFRRILERVLTRPLGTAETDDEILARLDPTSPVGVAARSFVDAWRKARYRRDTREDLRGLLDRLEKASR